MEKNEAFDIFKKDTHTLVVLKGNLPKTPSEEFTQFIEDLISNPANLVVNCFLADTIPEQWSDKLSVLHSLLPLFSKKVTFIHIPPNLKETFNAPEYQNFPVFENLLESLRFFDKIPKIPSKISFIKAFVSSVIQTFYFKAKIPTIRQKTFLKKEDKNLFMGVKTADMTVFGTDYFYNISVSFSSDDSFSMAASSILQSTQSTSEEERIAELFNMFLEGAKSFTTPDEKITFSETKVHIERPRPTSKITFSSKEYSIYNDGINVVIPFTYRRGDFFIEVWIHDQFGNQVLSTLATD